jgi:hypothetical protein
VLSIRGILVWIRTTDIRKGTDPDPSLFVIGLQIKITTKIIFSLLFLLIIYGSYIFIILQRKKGKKKSQNTGNQGFIYFFCLMMEGSGSGTQTILKGKPKRYATGNE